MITITADRSGKLRPDEDAARLECRQSAKLLDAREWTGLNLGFDIGFQSACVYYRRLLLANGITDLAGPAEPGNAKEKTQ